MGLALVAQVAACASVQAREQRGDAQVCPPGAVFYGDGMVAASLPDAVKQALTAAREQARGAASGRLSDYMADQPWQPHVSVIYGVTPEKAAPAWQALQAYLPAQEGVPMSFGGLQYWDDPKGNKTTLVVNILEPQQVLTHLHDRLAQAAQIGSRFAYHPHTTLTYLQLGTRFDAQQEAAIQEPLRGVTWQAETFYLTDPCGIPLQTAAVGAPALPHP